MASHWIHSVVAACAVLSLGVISGPPQQPTTATLVYVEGIVTLDDTSVLASSRPVVLGNTASIRTGEGGRAVVSLKGDGILAVNEQASVRVIGNDRATFNEIEIVQGSAIVVSKSSTPTVICRSHARLSSAGVFRFDVGPETPVAGGCYFRVFAGAAEVPLVSVTSALRSGQAMKLDPRCGDMIPTTPFATDALDAFDRWSRERATVVASR